LEQTPWGIGKALGNPMLTTLYGRPQSKTDLVTDQMGPFFGWANNLTDGVVQSMYDGGWKSKGKRRLFNVTPFRNLWAVEGFNRLVEAAGYDTPIGPTPRR
jgi:hypothetical protein